VQILIAEAESSFVHRHRAMLVGEGIELIVPMIVRKN
jgi:hypothetical protein